MSLSALIQRLRKATKREVPKTRQDDDFVRLGLTRLEDRVVLDGAGVVANINPGQSSSAPTELTSFNGGIYFAAEGTNASGQNVGRELFKLNADGSVSLVADINPGGGSSSPTDLTLFNDGLYFTAQGVNASGQSVGRELFRLNANGSVTLVADINPGAGSSDPQMLAEFSGKLYITAFTSAEGREPYVINNGGNASLIADLNSGSASSNPSAFYEFAGNLYFSAEVEGTRHLYRQAPSGSSDPVRVNLGEDVSDPREFTAFNGKLYFSAIDGDHGRELFVMSIGSNNRESVTEVFALDASSPGGFFVFGDNLYFAANDSSGRELYRLNTSGSIAKLNLASGSSSSSPSAFVAFNGDMYFAATVGGTRGLWRLDTSTAALAAVNVPLPIGVRLPTDALFYALDNELYFAADGPAGRELYVMNAARAVSLAADVNAGPASSNPAEVILFTNHVYFVATEASVGRELFVLRRDPSSIRLDSGKLIFTDDAGDKDNRLVISSTGTHLVIVDQNGHTITILTGIAGATGGGTNQVIIPLASLAGTTGLEVFTRGGNDSATFDLSANANSLLAQFVTSTYNGGTNTAAGDKLRFVGDGITSSSYTPNVSTTGSGVVIVSTPTQTLSFSFLALEPVDFTGMAVARLVTPTTLSGADVLTVSAGLDSLDGLQQALIVSGTVGGTTIESGYFFGNQTVVIDTGNGLGLTDSVTIASAANAHGNTNLVIDTGPLGQDVVSITGPVALAGQLQITTGALHLQSTVTLGGAATFSTRTNTTFSSVAGLTAAQVAMSAGGAIAMADGSFIDAGAGTISLVASGNVALGRLITTNSTAAAIVVTSQNGSILDNGDSGGTNIVAEGQNAVVTLSAAQGLGSAASPLDLAVRNLVVTSGGDQFLNELDDLSSLNLNAGSANIQLTAGGQIQDGDSAVDVRAASLTLQATAAGTWSIPLQTQIQSLAATATSGDLYFLEQDGLSVASAAALAAGGDIGIVSLSGNLTIHSLQSQSLATLWALSGSILSGAAGTNVTATNLEMAAATGIGASGAALGTQVQRLEASGGTGGVFVSNQGSLLVGGIAPSLLGLTGLSASASDIRVSSVSGAISTVESVVTSGGGAIALSAAAFLSVAAPVQSAAGPITLTAGRDITSASGGDITSTSGAVTLTADFDGIGGGAIALADGTVVDAGSGTIALQATGDITLGRLVTTNATSSAVLVRSTTGQILDGGDVGGPDISAQATGAVTTLQASGGIGIAANALDLAVRSLVTTTIGDQFLAELDDLASINLSAEAGNISLTAGGQIQDADTAIDVRAKNLTLQVTTAGTWAIPLQTQIQALTATAISGDLYFLEQDGLTVTNAAALAAGGDIGIVSLSGNVTIQSLQAHGLATLWAVSGSILSGAAGTNVTATNLELSAATGIGTLAKPLNTQVQRLEAAGGTGGVFVANQGDLQVGGISPSLLGLFGLAANSSDIVVSASGSLTVVESVATTAAGNISLSAATATVIQATSIGTDAGDILLVANPGAFPAAGSFSGITTINAKINSVSGDVTLQGQGGAGGGYGVQLLGSSVGQSGSGDVLLAGIGTLGQADIFWDTLTISKSGGTYTFHDTVQGTTLLVLPGPYQVRFLDGGSIQQAVNFQNTGGVVLGNQDGDTLTFTGGITSTAGPTTIQGTLITGGTNILLGSTTLVSTVTLLTGGGNVNIGAISGAGVPLTINAATGDVTLADPSNVIGNLTITADEVTLSENDDITQGGAWTTTGLTKLNSGTHDIVLTNPANQFGPLHLTGANTAVVEAGNTELKSVTWSGNLVVQTAQSLLVSGPLTGNGTAQLVATDDVTFAVGGSLVATGGSVNVGIQAGGAIALADGALIDAGAGTIALVAGGNITLGRLVTTNNTAAAVAVTSQTGGILDGGDSGGANIVAEGLNAVVTLSAAQGVGSAASPLDLAVRNLVVTSGGDQYLSELDDLSSLNLNAGSANIHLSAGGQIQDADGDVDIVAGSLTLQTTAAGTAATPLQTQVSQLAAAVGSDGLFLTNAGGLSLVGVQSTGGNIEIAAGGTLQATGPVQTSGAGEIELDAAGDVTVLDQIESASGTITLRATRHILAESTAEMSTTAGTILLLADSDNNGGGTIHYAGNIDVGAGQVIFSFPDADGLLSGVVSGTGGLVKQGLGTLTIAATSQNLYTGTTDLLAGTLVVNGAIGAAQPAQTFTLAAGTTLTGSGNVNAPIFATATTARIVSSGNLQLGDGSAAGFRFAGTLQVGTGHQVTLRDADLAELGLLTTIASGGKLTAANGVEVGGGETLAGSGAVSGNVVVLAGGQVSPGASPGMVTTDTGNLVLQPGAIYVAEVNGTQPGLAYDQINVHGTVVIAGSVLMLSGGEFSAPAGTVFTLIANDNSRSGQPDAVLGRFVSATGQTLEEGAIVKFGGLETKLSYAGGPFGNSVTLTVTDAFQIVRSNPPPETAPVVVPLFGIARGAEAQNLMQRPQAAVQVFQTDSATAAATNGDTLDQRPATADFRSAQELRVFFRLVNEGTGIEDKKDHELDPESALRDVLGVFKRLQFPNGRYRLYLQEPGKRERLIVEVNIVDGKIVPQNFRETESPGAPASPVPKTPAAPAPSPVGLVPPVEADQPALIAASEPAGNTESGERGHWATATILAGGAAAATAGSWRDLVPAALARSGPLPRGRFSRLLRKLAGGPPSP